MTLLIKTCERCVECSDCVTCVCTCHPVVDLESGVEAGASGGWTARGWSLRSSQDTKCRVLAH